MKRTNWIARFLVAVFALALVAGLTVSTSSAAPQAAKKTTAAAAPGRSGGSELGHQGSTGCSARDRR